MRMKCKSTGWAGLGPRRGRTYKGVYGVNVKLASLGWLGERNKELRRPLGIKGLHCGSDKHSHKPRTSPGSQRDLSSCWAGTAPAGEGHIWHASLRGKSLCGPRATGRSQRDLSSCWAGTAPAGEGHIWHASLRGKSLCGTGVTGRK